MHLITPDHLLTTTEAAGKLDVSPYTVRRLAAKGVLPAVQLAPRGRLRFRAEDVARLLEPKVVGGAVIS